MQPIAEAKRAHKPKTQLVYDIPEYETDLISTYHHLSHVHLGLSVFTRGYSLDSDYEVDIEHNNEDENQEGDEIMMVWGYPFFPILD